MHGSSRVSSYHSLALPPWAVLLSDSPVTCLRESGSFLALFLDMIGHLSAMIPVTVPVAAADRSRYCSSREGGSLKDWGDLSIKVRVRSACLRSGP